MDVSLEVLPAELIHKILNHNKSMRFLITYLITSKMIRSVALLLFYKTYCNRILTLAELFYRLFAI